jgi:hypothetical protein
MFEPEQGCDRQDAGGGRGRARVAGAPPPEVPYHFNISNIFEHFEHFLAHFEHPRSFPTL